MDNNDIRSALEDIFGEEELKNIVLFENPNYAQACVGVSEDNRLIYDYDTMVWTLVKEEGMTEDEAADFIQYNTLRALPYIPNSPIIMYRVAF